MDIPLQLLLQVVLILLNAFFASAEIAIISLNKTKLEKLSEDGDKSAKSLLKLTDAPANFLSTIQIGITLAGFLGSAFAADNFASLLANWVYNDLKWQAISYSVINTFSVILITIILSYFTLVFGELVPKRIAMQKPYKVAKFASKVISAIAIIMKPVIWFLSFSTNLILKIFRYKTEAEEENVTEDEIKMMVDLGEKKGTVEENEKKWIENVFEFNDTIVREIMTPSRDVKYVLLDNSRKEIEEMIRESGFSRYPVCKTNLNDVVGVLNIKDYFLNQDKKIKDLVRPAYFVPETTLCDDLFHNLQKTKNGIAIIVDEYGTTTGIITTEDLLEEIVGNIYDEYDEEEVEFKKISENEYQVAGDLLVSDLSEYLNMDIEESDAYDTVGGLIFSCLDSVPKDNSKITIEKDGLSFTVMKIQNRRIKEVIVKILPKKDDEIDKDQEK